MSALSKLRDKWRRNRLLRSIGITSGPADAPPVIMTNWGPVSEPMRLQAAMNMRADANIRQKVEELLAKQLGSAEAGVAESRRRYREAYPDLDGTY